MSKATKPDPVQVKKLLGPVVITWPNGLSWKAFISHVTLDKKRDYNGGPEFLSVDFVAKSNGGPTHLEDIA